MIFDTHAHYDDEAYNDDREQMIASLIPAGITKVTDIGADRYSTQAAIKIAETYDFIYAAAGIHPSEVMQYENGEADMNWLRKMAEHDKAVAIGEIGLDYYGDENPPRDIQIKWFKEQLQVAIDLDMPVVVHSRDAAQDTYDVLRDMGGDKIKAVVHCFSYESEMAKRFLDFGYYIGIGGVLTYKNARKQVETLMMMPLDRLLLETDCPYLSPVPHRGERNSSLNLKHVVAKMAELRGLSEEEIEDITYKNGETFYRL